MRIICTGLLLLVALAAAAQAPVQDRAGREQAIQRGQQRAGAAYRDLQQAQYEAKLAEQEFLNAQEAQARKAYDEALDGVDRARQR